MIGEPDAGKPPVRFDEGVQETCGIVTRLCPTLRHFPLEIFLRTVCQRTGRSSSESI